jgi:hypothetical protein
LSKIRGCALCGPLLSGDVISRVLRKLELSQKTQQSSFSSTDIKPRRQITMAQLTRAFSLCPDGDVEAYLKQLKLGRHSKRIHKSVKAS